MAKKFDSVSTFRQKWQANKKLVSPKVLKECNFNEGLGPAMDDLEKVMIKFDDAKPPSGDLKTKVEKALKVTGGKVELYLGKIKDGNNKHPELGPEWHALHEALYHFTKLLVKETEKRELEFKSILGKFLTEDQFEKRALPEVEQGGETKTKQKVGFDLSRNEVHEYNPNEEGPRPKTPGKDAMPTKGVLRQPGSKSTNLENVPDRDVPSELEGRTDVAKAYGRYVKVLTENRQDPLAAFGIIGSKKSIPWLPQQIKLAESLAGWGGSMKVLYQDFRRAVDAEPYDANVATAKFETLKTFITGTVIQGLPQEAVGLKKTLQVITIGDAEKLLTK